MCEVRTLGKMLFELQETPKKRILQRPKGEPEEHFVGICGSLETIQRQQHRGWGSCQTTSISAFFVEV